jgi:hypothetical protein
MVNDVEPDLAVQSASREVSGELPEVIMESVSAPVFFPKESPRWEIKNKKMDIRKGVGGEGSFDFLSPLRMCKHPDAVESRGLLDSVPPNAGI